MLTHKDITRSIEEHAEQVVAYGVKKIGIFGSFAGRRHSNKSDIDILVEFRKDGKAFDNYMGLKFYLERLFHRRIDLVIKEALKPRIKRLILREARYARL